MVDDKKRESFISENLRLVNHLCKRFSGRGIEYDDLYGAGCVGLVKAVDAFDETLGYQFSTYAVPVILGEIRRLFRDGGSVKVSRSVKELALKIAKEKAKLEYKLGREPKISEIAEALGVSAEDVVEAQNAVQPTVSLTIEDNDTSVQADIPVVSQDLFVENIQY
ncbi:MAG: sigma-70 family RNA polymerase sigma factor [Clostridia bacterium]|nr:sigma-70 family RNA polymerase sigma factor [Clostridia bacterium]